MQFERLKKSYRKQIIIGGLILVCVASAITITTTRAKYKLTENIPLVRGTINYKMPDMRVLAINISEDGTNYNIVDEIPTSGYELNSEKSVCKVAIENSGIENAPKDNNITIEYKEGKINFLGVTKHRTRCYLYFDKYVPITISDIIATLNPKDTTPNFSQIATTDEGVYKVEDGMYGGYSYYWRGAVTNNYVKFGNFCWRIIRINGDRSMRLIYDGTTCHVNGTNTAESVIVGATSAEKYYSTSDGKYDNSSYVGWTYSLGSQRTTGGTSSNAKTLTEKWYNANITGTNASEVADGKFCNDRNVQSGSKWAATGNSFYYAGYERLYTDYVPTLSCSNGDIYSLKVGLITADEVEFAGGKNENNTSYYLYNGQYYWTMSPGWWNSSHAGVFVTRNDGYLAFGSVNATNGLRPVINLRSDVTFASGNGTQSNPYVVA